MTLKTYPPDIVLAETRFDLPDIFSDEIIGFKKEVLDFCREFLKKKGAEEAEEMSEEYSVYALTNYEGEPEQFLVHKDKIAALLKSEKLTLDPLEVDYTLSAKIKYAKNDLMIVDWDGAFIFDPETEVEESTIEMLELANLQLLRYRLLDRQLDNRLQIVSAFSQKIPTRGRFLFKESDVAKALKETMVARSISISEYQSLEREIKLIGDWYSARLYDLVSKKFKLDEWRRMIKDKLDALEAVYSIAAENFTVSWERRSRTIEMIGWYILLVGWLILLILDFYFYRR